MPWWIVVSYTNSRKIGLMGPYETQSKAMSIKDGLDDGYAEAYHTRSYQRGEAAREIRHKLVEEGGSEEGYRNFSHKKVQEVDIG